MDVVLFHSMFGRRAVELAAAERLRSIGCHVVVPDLFEGASVDGDIEAGFALMDRVGWSTIVGRARRATRDLPDDAILGGLSMGVGVLGALWPERANAACVFCLHAPTTVPETVATGTSVQLHVASGDRFAPPAQIEAFRAGAARAGAAASVHTYPGVGHMFTDETLPDHDASATAETWARVLRMVRSAAVGGP